MATLEAVEEQIADTDVRNRLVGRRQVRALPVEQLERLATLQELGALTDLEFQVQKRRILEALGKKVRGAHALTIGPLHCVGPPRDPSGRGSSLAGAPPLGSGSRTKTGSQGVAGRPLRALRRRRLTTR